MIIKHKKWFFYAPTLFLLFLLIYSCSSSKNHYFQRTDGKWISQKRYERVIKRAVKKAFRKLSKEDKEILKGARILDSTEVRNLNQ